METLLGELDEALRPLRMENFVVLGHSMGVLVGLALVLHWQSLGGPRPRALFALGHVPPQNHPRTEGLWQLPEDELLQRMTVLDGLPPEAIAHPELRKLIVDTLRGDLRLHASYRLPPETRVETPIWAVTGTEDRGVAQSPFDRWAELGPDVRVERVPGGHFFPFKSPEFLPRLRDELERYRKPIER
jgi:medium-chain acyl-[acyl-carrier-protein] hydrolase